MERHTSDRVQQKIDDRTRTNVEHYARHPGQIDSRLAELDDERDTERVLEANAATLALGGTLLSLRDRRWAALPIAVTAFLPQHAVQGWCPPLPVIRRLGVRTRGEIDAERCALKALRGDFASTPTVDDDSAAAEGAEGLDEQEVGRVAFDAARR